MRNSTQNESNRNKSQSDKKSGSFTKKKSTFSSSNRSSSTDKPRFSKDTDYKKSDEKSSFSNRKSTGKPSFSKFGSDDKKKTFGGDFKKKAYGSSENRETGYKRPYNADKPRFGSSDDKKKTFGGGDFKKKIYSSSENRETGYKRPYNADKPRFGASDDNKRTFSGKDFKKKTYGSDDNRVNRETGYKRPYTAEKSRFGNSDDKKKTFGGDFKKKTYGSSDSNETGYKRPYNADKSRFGNSDDKKKTYGGGDFKKKTYGSSDNNETGYKRPYNADKPRFGNSDDKKKTYGGGDFKKKTYGSSDSNETGYKRPYNADKPRFGNSDDKKKTYGDSDFKKKFTPRDNQESRPFNKKTSFSETREKRPRIGTDTKKYRDTADKSSRFGREKTETTFQKPEYNLEKYEKKSKFGKKKFDTDETKSDSIRLNRFIANAGVCSRREADNLILRNLVKVNGKEITEMGYQVKPNDIVEYNGKILSREKMVYVLLNKPKNTITTTEDPEERRTVMDLVENACEERIYPVGRLDRNTMGLLLLTNDGELAKKLSHPTNNIQKIYQVTLDKPLTDKHFEELTEGLQLEDGFIKPDEVAMVDSEIVGIEIHSGKNRIVRRMFEHLGYEVVKLDRTSYASLSKKNLPRGEWRYLSEKEVIILKYY
jgi:23S rRNA pseudouridine2605 synthase